MPEQHLQFRTLYGDNTPPKIGIGACLAGQAVRYNGSNKKPNQSIKAMQEHMQLKPVCPELGAGLGVPREPIRLVDIDGSSRAMDSARQQHDYTEGLQQVAEKTLQQHSDLAGYILVKGSPSCGMERVKRYGSKGQLLPSDGVGIYAQRLMELDPLLPVEEDGRLNDTVLREHFIRRVYVYHDWKCLQQQFAQQGEIHHSQLINFYSRYKYLLMAHHIDSYKQLGRLLAKPDKQHPEQQAQRFITLLMNGLSRPANRRGYSNALSHIKGYLKRRIGSAEKLSLDKVIEQYRRGELPLVVPIRMLQHYFELFPDQYIEHQVFLHNYPTAMPANAA